MTKPDNDYHIKEFTVGRIETIVKYPECVCSNLEVKDTAETTELKAIKHLLAQILIELRRIEGRE